MNPDNRTAAVEVELPAGKTEIQRNVPLTNKIFHVRDPKSPAVDLKTAYEEMYGKKDLSLAEEHGDVHYWGEQPNSEEYKVSSKPGDATTTLKEVITQLVQEVIQEENDDHEKGKKLNLMMQIQSAAYWLVKNSKTASTYDIDHASRLIQSRIDELIEGNRLGEDSNQSEKDRTQQAIKSGKCKKCGKKIHPGTSSTLCPSCHEDSLSHAEKYYANNGMGESVKSKKIKGIKSRK
jgi:rubrerythrin